MREEYMSGQICVIDIGSSKVVCLMAYRTVSGLEIAGIGTCGYSCGYKYDNALKRVTELPDEKELANAVRRAVEQAEHDAGYRVKTAVAAVNAPFIKVEVYRGERAAKPRTRTVVEEDETNLGAISLESINRTGYVYIHSTPICYYADGRESRDLPIGKTIEHSLAADVSHVFLDERMAKLIDRCFAQSGIKRTDYVAVPLAEAHYLIPNSHSEGDTVLVDIGYRHMDISYIKNEAVKAIEVFPVGGYHLAGDVEQLTGIPLSNAEMIKKRFNYDLDYTDAKESIKGIDGSATYIDKDLCGQIIRARTDQMCDLILDTMDDFDVDAADTDVYVTGGGIMMENCLRYMAERMKVHVVQNYPAISRPRLNTSNNISAFSVAAFVTDLGYRGAETGEDEEKPRKSIFDKLFKK